MHCFGAVTVFVSFNFKFIYLEWTHAVRMVGRIKCLVLRQIFRSFTHYYRIAKAQDRLQFAMQTYCTSPRSSKNDRLIIIFIGTINNRRELHVILLLVVMTALRPNQFGELKFSELPVCSIETASNVQKRCHNNPLLLAKS